jgi:hypothetical protein
MVGGPYDGKWKDLPDDFDTFRVAKPAKSIRLMEEDSPSAQIITVEGTYAKWIDMGYGVWYYEWQGWNSGDLPEVQKDRT